MKMTKSYRCGRLTVLASLILISSAAGDQIPQEKRHVPDWLGEPEIIEGTIKISGSPADEMLVSRATSGTCI